MTTHTHGDFFRAFLTTLKLPVGMPTMRALACVSIFESSQGNEKWNNPLACEEPWPGSTNYNTAGVRIYRTFNDGVAATAELFSGSHWMDVRSHMKTAKDRFPILDAFSRAYSWADVDFASLPFNATTAPLDARLKHVLQGPS